MLAVTDLIAFVEAHKASRPNIEASITVGEDSEVSSLISELANANDHCTLITVIPSHDPDMADEDTRRTYNNLMFMVVKKYDNKAGNQQKLNNYQLCQTEIIELLNKIVDAKDLFGEQCNFNDADLSSAPITPLSNYFNQNGYLLQIATRTDF